MTTQKEIMDKCIALYPKLQIRAEIIRDFALLERQEAIKRCKEMIEENKFGYYSKNAVLLPFLIEFYSITDEELR